MGNRGLGVTMILLFEMDILHENAGWFMLVMKYPGEIQGICSTCHLDLMHLKQESMLLLHQCTDLGPCLLYFQNWDMGGAKESVSMLEIIYLWSFSTQSNYAISSPVACLSVDAGRAQAVWVTFFLESCSHSTAPFSTRLHSWCRPPLPHKQLS